MTLCVLRGRCKTATQRSTIHVVQHALYIVTVVAGGIYITWIYMTSCSSINSNTMMSYRSKLPPEATCCDYKCDLTCSSSWREQGREREGMREKMDCPMTAGVVG